MVERSITIVSELKLPKFEGMDMDGRIEVVTESLNGIPQGRQMQAYPSSNFYGLFFGRGLFILNW